MISPAIEEVLERLYVHETEQGAYPAGDGWRDALSESVEQGLTRKSGDRFELTDEGRRAGRSVLRRHRLAERLLHDVLDVRTEQIDDDACRFEHVLQDGLDDRVCVLLGHPRQCPHGRPIPEGECCRVARQDHIQEVTTLAEGRPDDEGFVAYLATRDSRDVQKLMAMGILPGARIRLIRRFPSYVFQVGYSQFTVDQELAERICVHWSVRRGRGRGRRRRRGRNG